MKRLPLLLLGIAVPASADPETDQPTVAIGGYIQPQTMVRQDDPMVGNDEDGFRLRRARAVLEAARTIQRADLGVTVEAELTPDFQLLDGYATAAFDLTDLAVRSAFALDVGQVKAPISRQELLGDAVLAFPEKAELASLAPGRQIGARLAVETVIARMLSTRVIGGMFNGEGRNNLHNVDEKFLYAGRLEVTVGARRPLAESDFGGGAYLTAAGSAGRNQRDSGTTEETVTLLGADIAGAWRGLSGSFEYLQARHDFRVATAQEDYRANGFTVHAAYLLPFAVCAGGRIEVGARLEEIDRNDTVAITAPGEADQSLRYYTGVVSYYQGGHALKAQLSYSHIKEVEDRTQGGGDAAHANDTLLLQLTYRME